MTRIVCLSDTHNRLDELDVPDGDVLVHAGDFSKRGAAEEVRSFVDALVTLPHEDKVVIAGNHDFLCEEDPAAARELLRDVHYLLDSGVTLRGLRFWGSPWQPEFFDWAFNLPRGAALAAMWALIPDETDVLVTHGPPRGILDRTVTGVAVGCDDLLAALARVRPRLHVFGHIHEAYGKLERDGTTFVNASNCDVRYRPVQPPITIDL